MAPLTPAGPIAPVVVLMGAIFAIAAAVVYRRRFVALLFLGAVGLVVAWVFVYLSAPDLALTQVLVELVTVVLMMLALHWLPQAQSTRTATCASSTARGRCAGGWSRERRPSRSW